MKKLLSLSDARLQKKLFEIHPYDLANILKDAEEKDATKILKLLSIDKLVYVFTELPDNTINAFFKLLKPTLQKEILNEFEMDDLKGFVSIFSDVEQLELIKLLPLEKQTTLSKLMSFDKEMIASIMTTEFVTINFKKTIKQATAHLISKANENNYIDELFVVDDDQNLVGSVSLKDLISARSTDSLLDITYNILQHLTLTDSIYLGMKKFRDYGISVLPVLENNLIVGIVTADDALTLMTLDYDENILKLQAIGDYQYDATPAKKAFQRLPWLLVSVILNLVIALILSVFERTLTEVVVLILFQPMILGMAGNIGTQSISVTILKINQAELNLKREVKTHVGKEMAIGTLNSILLGVIGFVVAFLVLKVLNTTALDPFKLSLTVGISLFGAMLISAIFGVFIPIVLAKLKIDPALASGPIISTINDLFALLVYFGVATIMFML